jgi:hypothetical protein
MSYLSCNCNFSVILCFTRKIAVWESGLHETGRGVRNETRNETLKILNSKLEIRNPKNLEISRISKRNSKLETKLEIFKNPKFLKKILKFTNKI